jgi:hypothetical protein
VSSVSVYKKGGSRRVKQVEGTEIELVKRDPEPEFDDIDSIGKTDGAMKDWLEARDSIKR